MPTREELHAEVDAVPEDQLDNTQVVVESNGAGASNGTAEAEQIPTLEDSIAILASVEFPPREEAWR